MTFSEALELLLTLLISIPWLWLLGLAHSVLSVLAVAHALLYKRDPRSAWGWISVCLLFPLAGPLLYYLLGINRIRTQARRLTSQRPLSDIFSYETGSLPPEYFQRPSPLSKANQRLSDIGDRLTGTMMEAGNTVRLLQNGEQAYPAMLEAIGNARSAVYLQSYIFRSDAVGRDFVKALAAARQRGVEVYVLVDGVGEFYSLPRISRLLRRAQISCARFLPPRLLAFSPLLNLRNHRKLMVIDQQIAFTGGMNIGAHHLLGNKRGIEDLHFAVTGPVVKQLATSFQRDWAFATSNPLEQTGAAPEAEAGGCYCRCITDGPDDNLDKIALTISAAISAASRSVRIVTPYFLPSREMIATLQSAALRGVAVDIYLPEKSNLRYVDFATRNLLWELLQYGVKVYYQQQRFAHTKLLVIDDCYVQIGSANLDPRSLRLNFELNMEVISTEFASHCQAYIDQKRQSSRALLLQEVESRALPVRLRDAICWLFQPYL